MKYIFVTFSLAILVISHAFAQESKSNMLPTLVDSINAYFPGGENGYSDFLATNIDINLPIKNKAPEGTYVVTVKFKVKKDGRISNLRSTSKNGYGLEKEVIRAFKNCPSWKPVIVNGNAIESEYTIPVIFEVKGSY